MRLVNVIEPLQCGIHGLHIFIVQYQIGPIPIPILRLKGREVYLKTPNLGQLYKSTTFPVVISDWLCRQQSSVKTLIDKDTFYLSLMSRRRGRRLARDSKRQQAV